MLLRRLLTPETFTKRPWLLQPRFWHKATWKDRYLFTHKGRWKTGEDPNEYQWQNFAVRNQRFRLVGEADPHRRDHEQA